MSVLAEGVCPVSDNLLGRLYRASPEGLPVLLRTVPPATRAALAYYCYRRVHLESIGLAIACTCDERDLYEHAGLAGLALLAKAKAEPTSPEPDGQIVRRGNVSLASGALWNPPPAVD